MRHHICFDCNKAIEDVNDYKMVGIDVPYVNLFFHKSCFILIGGYGNIHEYATQRLEMVYNYIENINKIRKNK
jgi:hypothetical protein